MPLGTVKAVDTKNCPSGEISLSDFSTLVVALQNRQQMEDSRGACQGVRRALDRTAQATGSRAPGSLLTLVSNTGAHLRIWVYVESWWSACLHMKEMQTETVVGWLIQFQIYSTEGKQVMKSTWGLRSNVCLQGDLHADVCARQQCLSSPRRMVQSVHNTFSLQKARLVANAGTAHSPA